MRAKTLFTIALTPFILSAATQKTPRMQKPSEDPRCRSPFHVMHVDVRHTESKGVGYKDGYTTLEGFGIYDHNPYFMPFLDLRGHVFNDGQLAGNVGLGERTVIPSINHLFGLYLYYDVRQEDHGLTVNQLSPGVEMLGKRMEYRINAYFPVGRDESHAYRHKFKKFEGNHIVLKNKKKYAMTGVDAEVGTHITQSTRHDFYFGIGPYYFTADPNNAWGGKTRLYWRYQDYVSLEASYSYDHIFKNIVQGTVAFSYPFGPKLKRQGRNCPNANDLALSRAAFAPYRFEIPVVETRKQYKTAINPAIGQPWKVWFVNNTSNSAGTYESPFPTLVQAQNASGPNDMIYVFPGDGTMKGMNAGITLQNGQKLFGSGIIQRINTTKGRIRIRAHSATAPMITNVTDAIFLADGNEISGMNVLVTGVQPGITGMAGLNINGMHIHDNVINILTGANASGIGTAAFGSIKINNNLVVGGLQVFTNTAGISLDIVGGQPTNVKIVDNVISGHQTGVFVSSPVMLPFPASCNCLIAGNVISGFAQSGILVDNVFSNSTFNVVNNIINDTSSFAGIGFGAGGIAVRMIAGPTSGVMYNIQNNIVTTTTSSFANSISLLSIGGINASTRASITNNTVVTGLRSGSYGINMNAAITNTICATITNNKIQAAGAGTNGMSISGGGGIVNIDDFSNNIAPNVLISQTGAGAVNFAPPGTCGQ